jgi:hypothetical protein
MVEDPFRLAHLILRRNTMAELIYSRHCYSFDAEGATPEEPAWVDNSKEISKYKVGQFFVTWVAAPGYGKISYIITRIDDQGIWGVVHEDTSGVLELRDVI